MFDGGSLPPLLGFLSTGAVQPALTVADLPRHHRDRPHILANALMAAKTILPDSAWLADAVLPLMPRRPRASQNLRAITRDPSSSSFLLDEAITLPWCATDSETHRNSLLIDIDHDDALDRWMELPERIRPILVLDPWSGRAHAIAFLASPVLLATRDEITVRQTDTSSESGKKALLGPQMMADLAGRLLAAALGGKLLPPGSVVKNPWGQAANLIGHRRKHGQRPVWEIAWDDMQARGLMWSTRPGARPVELRTLVAALADRWWGETAGATARFSTMRYAKKRGDPSWLSRNCWVFDLTRWWAYDRAERDTAAITEAALNFNADLANPLPPGDVRATARSISRFMSSRFRPRYGSAPTTRGRDAADGAALSLPEKQALAARKSAAAHAAATDRKIAAGYAEIVSAGGTISQAAVAAGSGVSISTVKRRWPLVSNAVLSGSAAQAALGPQARPASQNQNLSPSLASRATLDRRLKSIIGRLANLAATAMRPSARPPVMVEIPADLSGYQSVRKAAAEARQAVQDAHRRAAARAAKAAAAVRADEFRKGASGPFPMSWWSDYRAALDAEWDAREQEPGLDRHDVARLRVAREATFAARWRLWRAVNRPRPVPPPLVESRSARVARMVRDNAENLADLDRTFGPDSS